jgi:hypothetical protein
VGRDVTPRLARSGRHFLTMLTAAAAASATASLLTAPRTLAYPAPGYAGTLTSTCTVATPGRHCALTFTLTQPNGQPAGGVASTFAASPCGTVSPASAVTDSQGQVALTFIAGQSCCGTVTVTADAATVGVTAQTQISIMCPGLLPATAAAPPAGGSGSIGALALLVVAVAAFAASTSALLRRRSLDR